MGFRYDIQGLRALAVILVFIFHLNSSWLPGGFIGVDIFFVISGYLVSKIIIHKKEKGTFTFIDFYVGRIKRIVPVFTVMLISVILLGAYVYLSGDISNLRRNVFWTSLFFSNNYFATLDNYFGASSLENPLLHTWTLSIEMQFYFILPLLIIFFNKKYLYKICVLLILILFSYSFYNSFYLSNKGLMYFSLLARIPEFLIGIVFTLKEKEWSEKFLKNKNVFSFISIIGLIVVGFVFREEMNFPGLWVLFPCFFTGILLIQSNSISEKFLSNKFLVRIGELSYSIYLWHWPIMAYIRYYSNKTEFSLKEIFVIIVLTGVLSVLSYNFIENKYRVFDNRVFFRKFGSLVVILLIVFFSLPRLNARISPIPELFSKASFGLDSHSWRFTHIETFGDTSKERDSICLIGDSHALAYKGFLDIIGKNKGFNYSTISNDRCPPIKGIDKEDFETSELYEHYSKLVLANESLIESSNLIIISSVWSDAFPSLEKAFKKFVESLPSNKKIVILGDYPVFDKNPLKINRSIIYQSHYKNNRMYIKDIPDYVKDVIKQYPSKVYYIEFDFNVFENLPFINDTIAYYDDGHWNYYGSKKNGIEFSEYFYKFIQNIILKDKIN